MPKAYIYHNPRCSKSRATLALLEAQNVDLEIIKYLDHPPAEATIADLLSQLSLEVRDILRTTEADYKEHGFAEQGLTAKDLMALLHQYPKVMERPIVTYQNQAVIGRPPENVLRLFS